MKARRIVVVNEGCSGNNYILDNIGTYFTYCIDVYIKNS